MSVRASVSIRAYACATPRQASASGGGGTVKAQKSHYSLSNTYGRVARGAGRLYDFLQEKNEVLYNRYSQ